MHRPIIANAYDLAMRIPILAVTGYFLEREWTRLIGLIAQHPYFNQDWGFLLNIIAQVSTLIFLILLLTFHAVRRRPIKQFDQLTPKITALFGMGFAYLLLLLPMAEQNPVADLLAATFLTVGNFLCIVSVLALGRSLSIMPEARKLITDGMYTYIRHPLYLAELVADIGIFIRYRSWMALFILTTVILLQIRRMHWEEAILNQTFSEYKDYKSKTWRLLPGVY